MESATKCPKFLLTVGERIRFLRKQRGLSQEQLSELIGVHTTSLSNIERGKSNGFLCTYLQVAKALDVDMADLFETTAAEDVAFWKELRVLLNKVKSIDPKKRDVFLDSAANLLTRIESL